MAESDDDDDEDLDYAREEARWRRSQGGGPRRRQRSECCGGDCFASCSDFLQLLICECGLCVPLSLLCLLVPYLIDRAAHSAPARSTERLGQPTRRFASSPLDGPVGIIFMWVNGSDPQHVRSYASAQERGLLSYRPHASRFRDEGIFEYVLRSAMACSTLSAPPPPPPPPPSLEPPHPPPTHPSLLFLLAHTYAHISSSPRPRRSVLGVSVAVSQTRHVYLVTAGEMPTRLPQVANVGCPSVAICQ